MAVAVKRERSSNWSLAEITILTDFVEKNEEVLKAKQSNIITNAKKNSKWAEVTDLVNAVGVQRRSVEQVKFKWGNLQQGAKKTFTEARKHARKTGGGPPLKPPTAAEEKIIDLMKDRPNFSGIAGGFESSMPTTSEMPSSPKSASTSSSTFESTCSTLDFSLKATAPSTEEVAEQTVESACTSEPNIASEGDKTISHVQIKRRKISFEHLQKMQYERKNIELQNMKLQKDLERADLEKQNMELQNSKLALQIECLKQTVTQNENALLALQAITDE
uniref:Myb/SANT-like DNA-binding domain-containing protein n=1 Tax=Magallana gigas TaxID=29159 RepID=A0A8W8NU71_MAGGI